MKLVYFVFICVVLFKEQVYSQVTVKGGIFKGGICAENGICGFWFLNKNKKFVFIDYSNNYIKTFGSGSWDLVNDSIVKFDFKESPIPVLVESSVVYNSTTRSPFDSIYINGRVINKQNTGVAFASIIINRKYQTVTNSEGFFRISLPHNVIVDNLIVLNKVNGFKPIEIQLNRNNNIHNINVVLPLIENHTSSEVYNSDRFMISQLSSNYLELKLNMIAEKKIKSLAISFISSDKTWIIETLESAKLNQPIISLNIDELLRIIKQ